MTFQDLYAPDSSDNLFFYPPVTGQSPQLRPILVLEGRSLKLFTKTRRPALVDLREPRAGSSGERRVCRKETTRTVSMKLVKPVPGMVDVTPTDLAHCRTTNTSGDTLCRVSDNGPRLLLDDEDLADASN